MSENKRRVPSSFYLQSAWRQDKVADEMRAMADKIERQEKDHECGHQWTISVSSIEHYGITGDPKHYDAEGDIMEQPGTVTVRAHNLSDALRKAAGMPLNAWYPEPEDDE